MRENLIIARVGDKSLHPRWFDGGDRNWDIAFSSFGTLPLPFEEAAVLVEREVGPKWPPLHDLVRRQADLIGRYRYIMMPDDDLIFSTAAINLFFDLCKSNGFAIAQPSLDYDSYFSHAITIRRPFLQYRVTNFVEVMTPCFRRDILERLLPSLAASRSGWGIDDGWSAALAGTGERMAIVDQVSVTHTRPVGGELYRNNVLTRSPSQEFDDLQAGQPHAFRREAAYGCTPAGIRIPRAVVRGLGLLSRLARRRDGGATWSAPSNAPA